MVRSLKSALAPGPSLRPFGGRSTIGTRAVGFPAAGSRSARGITSGAQGGPTTLSNLALLCRRHHRAVHEKGYQVDRQPDGELSFRRPDGRLLPEVPPPVAIPADPVQALRARHDVQGLRLHARTAIPGWLGERLDVGWAIDVMHPLAGETRWPRLGDRRGDSERGKRKQARTFFNVGMAKKFMQTVLAADALAERQRANLTTSLREIYYRPVYVLVDNDP
jgi:hypothetical protein